MSSKSDVQLEEASGQSLKCRFCGERAPLTHDDAEHRVHACARCGAANVISKGQTWWYHGWTRPDGERIDADGRHSSGNRFGWWLNKSPKLALVAAQ